jgi:hypothetical protein
VNVRNLAVRLLDQGTADAVMAEEVFEVLDRILQNHKIKKSSGCEGYNAALDP